MEWETHSQRQKPYPATTGYLGIIPTDDWEEVAKQLPALWQKLCEAMILHHGNRPPEEWEAFLCMVTPGGGNIHIAPVRLPWEAHIDRTWVMIKIPLMEEEYFALPDPDGDAAVFEAAHDSLMRRAFGAIRKSAASPQAQECLRHLWHLHPFVVYGIQYDDKETMVDLGILGHDMPASQ